MSTTLSVPDSVKADAVVSEPDVVRPHVVVLSFRAQPAEGLTDYVAYLLERGVLIDLVVLHPDGWAGFVGHGNLRVCSLKHCDDRYLPRRLAKFALFTVPGKTIRLAKRAAGKTGVNRLRSLVSRMERVHKRLAKSLYRRVYLPIDSGMRPWGLAMLARKSLRHLDLADVERIVGAEAVTVPSAWKLAKRQPQAVATTALDRTPYAALEQVRVVSPR